MRWLSLAATQAFKKDSSLLEINPPAVVFGNTNGDLNGVMRAMEKVGWPPHTRLLFLGNVVQNEQGTMGLFCLVCALKVAYPENIYLIRGPHELDVLRSAKGFVAEIVRYYGEKMFASFEGLFGFLPVAALIGQRIFCSPSGISPTMGSFQQIQTYRRPMTLPKDGLRQHLLWAAPNRQIHGFERKGSSFVFGEDAAIAFCERMNVDVVLRSHQVVQDGYELFANGRLCTVFSTRDFQNSGNRAAVIGVDENLRCSIEVID